MLVMGRQIIQLNLRKSARQEQQSPFVGGAAPCSSHGRSAGVRESQVSHVFPDVSFMNCSVLYTGKGRV